MRLFVAAELPEPLRDALSETSAALRESVAGRYVAPDSLHVTLAFLGEVDVPSVGEAVAAVEEACACQVPFRVSLGGFGSFGRARKALLWQGFAQGVDELGALAGDVRECLSLHGLAYDSAAFVPHVTLMRNADLSEGPLPMPVVERGVVDTVCLFRSDLSGPRPRYEALARVTLMPEPEPESEDGLSRLFA
jgi:2'-5' RNA ligase